MPKCIECDANLQVGPSGVEPGEIIECPECGTELEVVNKDPVQLDYAPQEEEDWGE